MKKNAEIREKMKVAKLTQGDLADEMGVSVQTIGNWLSGDLSPEKRSEISKVIDRHIESSVSGMKVMYDDFAFPIQHAHEDDAGYDLCIPVDAVLPARGSLIIDTGVHVAIPKGYVGMLKSKSGLNVKHSIRGEGVIDSGYTGSIVVKLYNDGYQDYTFARGNKVIQLVIQKVATPEIVVVDSFEDTERGDNGFGSTGK